MRIGLIGLIFFILCYFETEASLPSEVVSPYFKPLTIEHGIKSRWVHALEQDSHGFMWIGTSNGLQRYDGYQTLDMSGPQRVLETHAIYDLYLDKQQRLWVGNDLSAFIVDTQNLSVQQVNFEFEETRRDYTKPVFQIKEDAQGTIWLSRWHDLYFVSNKDSQAHKLSLPLEDFDFISDGIVSFAVTENTILLGTTKGLYRYDRDRQSIIPIPIATHSSQLTINDILVAENAIWVAADQGLFKLSPSWLQGIESVVSEVTSLRTLSFTRQETDIWVASDLAIFKIDVDARLTKVFEFSTSNQKASQLLAYKLKFDHQNYLWIATAGQGIYRWNPRSRLFRSFLKSDDHAKRYANSSIIWSFLEQKEAIWVGTEDGLFEYTPELQQKRKIKIIPDDWSEYERGVLNIVEVDDHLWLNTMRGLFVFDPKRSKKQELNASHPELFQAIGEREILTFNKINNDELWIGLSHGFVIYNTKTNAITGHKQFKAFEGSEEIAVTLIEQDEFGDLWLGTNKGLYKVDQDSNQIKLLFDQDIKRLDPYTAPTDLYRENANKLWISYDGAGVVILDIAQQNPKVVHQFDSDNGLSDMNVFSLKERNGSLWMSTHGGLMALDTHSHAITKLTAFDGIPVEEFNQTAHYETKKGQFLFGSVNGFVAFDPEQLSSIGTKGLPIKISQLQLLNPEAPISYFEPGLTRLTFHERDIGFNLHVTDFDFMAEKHTMFTYWLNGDHRIRAISTNQNLITMAGLPFGDYQLIVSTSGIVDRRSLILPFSIEPYAWHAPAAIIGYLAAISLIISIILARYFKRLQNTRNTYKLIKLSQQRLQLALESTHSGVWEWHSKSNSINQDRFNQFTRQENIELFSQHFDRVHPEDKTEYLNAWNEFVIEQGPTIEHVYRLLTPENQYKWFQDIGKMTRDPNSNDLVATGIFMDISEKKEKDHQIKLFGKAYQSTSDAVAIVNHKKEIITVNNSFNALTGLNDAVGSSIEKLHCHYLPVDFYQQIIAHLSTHPNWEGESWLVGENGRSIPAILRVGVTRTTSGKPEYYFFIWSDISALKEAEYELRQLANYDPLTKLPNRSLLNDRIEHAIDHANRFNKKIAVFFIDLDNFKTINDTLGHNVGDELLIEVAKKIQQCLSKDDTTARIGGDEFVLLIENIQGIEDVSHIGDNLLKTMSEPMLLSFHSVTISPSIGISLFPLDGRDSQTLMKNADTAMYHAKSSGRNNFQFFTEQMNQLAAEQLALEQALRHALTNDELYPVFQPRFKTDTLDLIGFEVLLRWRRCTGQHIDPSKFIPVAEELNLILPITEWLFTQIGQIMDNHRSLLGSLEFAINLSANHFLNYDLVGLIKQHISIYQLEASKIEFEITESAIMQDIMKSTHVIEQMKALGIKVSIDDFGTGYSSLNYLKDFNVDRLKIDRSFVCGIGVDRNSEAIVDTIIQLSKNLSLEVVAEGIETSEQLQFLQDHHCDYLQGYLLAKPLDTNQLIALLNSGSTVNH